MSKRKTFIELQSKPENKAVRRLFDKPKPVNYAPINKPLSKTKADELGIENQKVEVLDDSAETRTNGTLEETLAEKTKNIARTEKEDKKPKAPKLNKSVERAASDRNRKVRSGSEGGSQNALPSNREAGAKADRLRIFQTSTPVTRTVTKFQKAAIVVRGENGKQLVELLWRDQMNEKTRDIWDFLAVKFAEAGEPNTNEISIRKREILDGSGVKSDRTFINAVYTLEDMGLIEVKRLSGNKEGNIYILTEEGKDEMDGYEKQNPERE